MANVIKVDMHFHPNLMTQGYNEKAAIRILDKCIENDLNVIICTEHVFKEPLPAFRVLYSAQQKLIGLSKTSDSRFAKYSRLNYLYIFPGIEYFTSEGTEFVIFHWDPGIHGKTMIEYVTEKNPNFAKERALSSTEVIDLAKGYGLSMYAPHPSFTFTGGVAKLGKAIGIPSDPEEQEKERTRIAQLVRNRGIGMSIHNAAYDDVLKILDKLNAKIPLLRWVTSDKSPEFVRNQYESWEKLSDTPKELLDDAQPKFHGGGNDAHMPEAMVTYLEIPIPRSFESMSAEEIYEVIIHNKNTKVVRPEKKGWFKNALMYNIKTLGIVLKEKSIEDAAEKEIEKEKEEILEAYVKAYEQQLSMEDIIKIKGLFPGQQMLTLLSKSQIERIKKAKQNRSLFYFKRIKKALEDLRSTLKSKYYIINRNYRRMKNKIKNIDSSLPLEFDIKNIEQIKSTLLTLERRLLYAYYAQEAIEKKIRELNTIVSDHRYESLMQRDATAREINNKVLEITQKVYSGTHEEGGYERIIENIRNLSRILSALKTSPGKEELLDVIKQWRAFAQRGFDEEALQGFNLFFQDETRIILESLSQKDKAIEANI